MALDKVEDLRSELQTLGYSQDEIKGLGRQELKELLKTTKNTQIALDAVETTPDVASSVTSETKADTVVHNPTDPDWTEYVLTLFDKRELDKDNGMPKVDGLRRVAEFVLGTFSSITDVIQVPSIDNAGRATVVVKLVWPSSYTVTGAADVFAGNTMREYAIHPVATAETRAEGRALRKALRLTKILAAEEMANAPADEPNGTDQRIVSSMLTSLEVMAGRLGVDLHKVSIKMGFDIQTTQDLTQKQGIDIANKMGKYQRKEEPITDDIKK